MKQWQKMKEGTRSLQTSHRDGGERRGDKSLVHGSESGGVQQRGATHELLECKDGGEDNMASTKKINITCVKCLQCCLAMTAWILIVPLSRNWESCLGRL